jgi:Transposase DDE domain
VSSSRLCALRRLSDGKRHRHRESTLSTSEVMTIVILFQASGFRNFKTYYTQHVCKHLRGEFPNLVSYQRLVELQSEIVLPLAAFLRVRFGPCTGISFIDSTPIKVCHNLRIKSNKVFRELARRGKTSTGWFYGFKVHLVISDRGDLLAVMITPGNVDDRKPAPRLAQRLFGKLFGDRGYISKELFALLSRAGRATDHQDQEEYEEQVDADARQNTLAQASARARRSMISSRTLVRSSIRATAAWLTSLSICWPHWSPTLIRRRNLLSIFILMSWRLCQRPFFNLSYVELTLPYRTHGSEGRGWQQCHPLTRPES